MNDPFDRTFTHYTNLTENHRVGPASDINLNALKDHLLLWHGVSVNEVRTKAEAGRLHLLVHAIIAHPELAELMNLPDRFGRG
jgi:hypothetical protein